MTEKELINLLDINNNPILLDKYFKKQLTLYGEKFDTFDVKDLVFNDVYMKEVTFKEITIINCVFYHCNLINSNFVNVKIEKCRFYNCNLSDGLFNICSLNDVQFFNSDLESTNFMTSRFNEVKLKRCELSKSVLPKKEEIRKGIILERKMIGWKKCINETIVELEIPKGAIVLIY